MATALALSINEDRPKLAFDRVDVISEDPGFFLRDDAPRLGFTPRITAIRYVEQVKVAVWLPVPHLAVGASLSSQSVVYERSFTGSEGLGLSGGLQTRLLCPRGALFSLVYRRGPVRMAVGLNAVSDASWHDLSWDRWQWLPAIGLGIGRSR